ncbi:MAG: SDR family oxidoreductase, partial [Candidatus Obscuribacterales bacterium]|nr:SDR family oxidoreductase [Candidatus Obscuribacterales bacterium]
SSVINRLVSRKRNRVDIIGFDVQEETSLPVAEYHQCDLRSREDIKRALGAIACDRYHTVRLLICASVMNKFSVTAEKLDEDMFYEEMLINLTGPGYFATALARRCIAAGTRARVVFVGSTGAYVGSNDASYAAAKAGLDGLSQSLSKYLAPQGVSSFVVHTGIFDSAMSAEVSQARQAKTIGMTHIKRKGSVEEIRDFVLYYLLEAPDFATGGIVEINGGQHS